MSSRNPLKLSIQDDDLLAAIAQKIKKAATATVEVAADTLTDRPKSETFTPEEIEWMQRTPVAQITFGEPYIENTRPFFDLKENREAKLKISAGSTNNGELRGDTVRSIIKQAQTANGQQTLYDALQSYIRQPANSSEFIYAANAAVGRYLQSVINIGTESVLFNPLRELYIAQLKKFAETMPNDLLEKIDVGREGLPPDVLVKLKTTLNEVIQTYQVPENLKHFFKAYSALMGQINIIEEKAEAFGPNSEEFNAAQTFLNELNDATEKFERGDITTISTFIEKCQQACETAENSVLKNHRGWKQVFVSILSAVATLATVGIANLVSKAVTGRFDFSKTDTDSIAKVKSLKAALNNIKTDLDPPSTASDTQDDTLEEEQAEEHEPTTPTVGPR